MMTAAPTASFSASDAMLVEGNDGTQYAAVYVSLSAATSKTTQVSYNTADGTANAGSDYLATSGALTFAPGVTTRTVLVPVKGDRLTEANENFVLNLRGAKGAKIADGQGVVTIVDDEPRMRIEALSAFAYKGDSGTTPFTFTVSLSAVCDQAVTVNYATSDGSAVAGVDYLSASGTLSFAPGETTKIITVDVYGGPTTATGTKTFSVNLSGASSNVLLSQSSSTGSIIQYPGSPDSHWDSTAFGTGGWVGNNGGDPNPGSSEAPY